MEQKYFYFGIRRKVSTLDANGRTRSEMRVIWAPRVYNSAKEAAAAAAEAMVTRLGVSFFIQGFDKPLAIQKDGTCTGFATEEGK